MVEVVERVKFLSKFEKISDDVTILTLEEYKDSLMKEVHQVLNEESLDVEKNNVQFHINGPIIKLGESNYIRIMVRPDLRKLKKSLQELRQKDISSIGICLMHSYIFHVHEDAVYEMAKTMGFSNISCSSRIFPKVNFVRRGNATLLDAYLNPIIAQYLSRFLSGFSNPESISINEKKN